MKKIISVIAVSFLFFITSSPAYAHVLQSNGPIGAVLHINPEDDPIIGQPASFFFEFKDKENKFLPEKCNCTVRIFQSGKEIYTQPLFQDNDNPSLTNASFSFVFPQKDVYTIQVSGKPTQKDAFSDFVLTYDIRITRDAENGVRNDWVSTHIVHISVGVALLVMSIFFLIKKLVKKS